MSLSISNNPIFSCFTSFFAKDIKKYPPYILNDPSKRGSMSRFILRYIDSINISLILYLFLSYMIICSLLTTLTYENEKIIIALSMINTFISLIFTTEIILNLIFLGTFYLNPYYYGYFYFCLDIIAGPGAILMDIGHFLETGRIGYYGNAMRLAKLFTLHKIRILIREVMYMLPKCSSILFSIFFVFYIFSFLGKVFFSKISPEYFGNMSKSMLSMFQVLTQDDWRYEISDPIMKHEGFASCFFFLIFMIVMFYTFLNIFLGIFVAYYSNPNIKKNMDYDFQTDDYLNEDLIAKKQNSITYEELLNNLNIFHKNFFLDKLIKFFDRIIYSYWFVTIINNYFSYYLAEKHLFGSFILYGSELIYGFLFTIHLIILLFISDKKHNRIPFLGKKITYPEYIVSTSFIFDFIAGPLSLTFDMIQLFSLGYMQIGPVLRILKLLNTIDNKQIINRLYEIMPRILPVFCLILTVIYYSAFYATFNLKYAENAPLFANFRTSFLTLFQIMTLDNWGEIARTAYKEKPFTALFFVGFILITSFFLVSIVMGLIANSSNDITEKIFENTIKSNELISKEEYPEILEDLKQVFHKIDEEQDSMKFVESLNPEEKEEYYAVKELLDDFNNSENLLKTEEKKKKFGRNEEKKENNDDIRKSDDSVAEISIVQENKLDEMFSDKASSSKEDDCLFIHFKDKIFKIKTKNFLIMRE